MTSWTRQTSTTETMSTKSLSTNGKTRSMQWRTTEMIRTPSKLPRRMGLVFCNASTLTYRSYFLSYSSFVGWMFCHSSWLCQQVIFGNEDVWCGMVSANNRGELCGSLGVNSYVWRKKIFFFGSTFSMFSLSAFLYVEFVYQFSTYTKIHSMPPHCWCQDDFHRTTFCAHKNINNNNNNNNSNNNNTTTLAADDHINHAKNTTQAQKGWRQDWWEGD